MNLQEQINRIQEMMGIQEYGKPKIIDYESYIVSKPIKGDSTTTIIFGGYLVSPRETYSYLPKEFINKKNVVVTQYNKSYNTLIEELKKDIDISKITSVIGYSAGAKQLGPVFGKYNFIGLVDPWITNDLLNNLKNNTNNVICWYTKEFWINGVGNMTETSKLQPKLKSILGSRAVLKNMSHKEVAISFMNSYSNKF